MTGQEIENLKLRHTQLVVLASCRSGTGKILEAEGATSAARAFLAAGAGAVIASLFNLDDRAVERLVSALHERIARGVAPAAALRSAQLEAIADSSDAGASGRFGWASLELVGVMPAAKDSEGIGGKTNSRPSTNTEVANHGTKSQEAGREATKRRDSD
jgi:CHAT domain-containing protein